MPPYLLPAPIFAGGDGSYLEIECILKALENIFLREKDDVLAGESGFPKIFSYFRFVFCISSFISRPFYIECNIAAF